MTLRENIASDVDAVFLQTTEFAEDCTYLPKGRPDRTVKAVVDEDSNILETERGLVVRVVLLVLVSRDADTGIAEPQIGDALKREGEERAYAFTGVRLDVDETAWTLEFANETPYQLGGQRL